jgi:hypothetical protein
MLALSSAYISMAKSPPSGVAMMQSFTQLEFIIAVKKMP